MIKILCAAAMSGVIRARDDAFFEWNADSRRCFATALTDIESGQMFAVKGLFQSPK